MRSTIIIWIWAMFTGVRSQSQRTQIKLFRAQRTWNDAVKFCSDKGMKLLEIRTEAKAKAITWINSNSTVWYNRYQDAWISLHDPNPETENGYSWLQGCTPLTDLGSWTNWYPNEPLNYQSSQCIKLHKNNNEFVWRTNVCGQSLKVLCELTQGPCTFKHITEFTASSSIKNEDVNVANVAECQAKCLTVTDISAECWAFTFNTVTRVCTLHFSVDPFYFDSNQKSDSALDFYIKRCFEGQYDDTTDTNSPDTSPTPGAGCQEGVALQVATEPTTTIVNPQPVSSSSSPSTRPSDIDIEYSLSSSSGDLDIPQTSLTENVFILSTSSIRSSKQTNIYLYTQTSSLESISLPDSASLTTLASITTQRESSATIYEPNTASSTIQDAAPSSLSATSTTTISVNTPSLTASTAENPTLSSQPSTLSSQPSTLSSQPSTPSTTTPNSVTNADEGVTSLDSTCSCYCHSIPTDIQQRIEQLYKTLFINKKTTSQYIRTKISVSDSRPSAQGIGYAGVCCLVATATVLVLADVRYIIDGIKRIKTFKI